MTAFQTWERRTARRGIMISLLTHPGPARLAACLGVLAMAGLLAACGSSTPPPVTVHGTVTPSSGSSSVFGQGMNSTSYVGCAAASPAPGTQVTVSSPSGTVIGTGTLGVWNPNNTTVSGTTIYTCDMPFTIKNIPQETRYGFAINGVPGTIWESSVTGTVSLAVGGS
jgi:hypothetical protein